MELTTQCPQCGEVFQASLEQLQLRKGYVRCIGCAHIFDGYEAVVPAASARHSEAQGASSPIRHTLEEELPEHDDVAGDAQHHVVTDVPEIVPISTTHTREEHHVHVSKAAAPVAAEPFGRRDPVFGADDECQGASMGDGGIYVEPRQPYGSKRAADIPEFLDQDTHRFAGIKHGLWWGLSLLALLVLLAQAAYIYRVQLANSAPALRPALERLCLSLECTVDYPREIDRISILSSSLRVRKSSNMLEEQDSALMLAMTLRNEAQRPQHWPAVILDLTDFSGAVVVRKVLQPSEYLPQDKQSQPFTARTELAVQIPLDVRGSKVNGYQLSLFFP